ncbi:MAG: glycosyltransferase family 2 protein [Clostridia bacterium]|nr:glycosyltransferase family 2 protein [Clostridia bacterium]
MKILLIIPAYNEQENIVNTVKKIKEYGEEIDYIVINDGSKDNTLNILKENNIKHINLIQNLGIGGAVQTGYKYAYENNYDIAIQFDGDGQHDVSYISAICEPIIKGQADMSIGTRYLDKKESEFQSTFMRRLGSKIISIFIRIFCGKKITDPTSGFRAANKKVIEEFAKEYPIEYPEPESTVSLLVNKYKIEEVPVSMNERTGGVSSIRLWKTVDYMVKVVLAIIIDSISFRRRGGKR